MRFIRTIEPVPAPDMPFLQPADDLETAVPLASDFHADEEPTPVDQTFALRAVGPTPPVAPEQTPQPAPSQPSALPAGVQPGMQVVPVAQVVPPAVREIESKPLARWSISRRKAIIFSAAGAAILLFLIVGLVLKQRPKGPPPLTSQEYNAQIEAAVGECSKGNISSALALLNEVKRRKARNAPSTDVLLCMAIEADQAARQNFTPSVWEKADERWTELADDSHTPPAARKLAEERIQWLRKESANLVAANKAAKALERQNWEDFLTHAARITPDSMFRPRVEKEIPLAKKKFIENTLKQAEEAMRDRTWARAIEAYNKVKELAPELAAEAESKIELCKRYIEEKKELEAIEELVRAGRPAEALDRLQSIRSDSPYATTANRLRAEANRLEVLQRARQAYNSGRGEEAVKILEAAHLGNEPLATRIRRVLENWNAAEQALKEGKFAEAQAAWRAITDLEQAKDNYYRLQAEKGAGTIPAQTKRYAQEWADKGEAAYREREYRKARSCYEQALQLDPENPTARNGVRTLKREAVMEYNKAVAEWNNKNRKDAIELLNAVKDRLLPGETYYIQAEDLLKKIEGSK